jgi:Ser/Thr protein kinase RdoA (MazF antagonist)
VDIEKNIKVVKKIPTLEQVCEICRQYGLGNLISIMGEIEDSVNSNLKILTERGTYVIKALNMESQRFDFILSILLDLDKNNIPVLLPLKREKGLYTIKFDTQEFQVTKFIYGKHFLHNRQHAWYSGNALRRFHDILTEKPELVKPKGSIYPSEKIIKTCIDKMSSMENEITKEQISYVNDMYEKIVRKWEERSRGLPQTIIHGDWNQRNHLYSDAGEVSCIMDFDFITRAERLFDVAYSLWFFQVKEDSMDVMKAFMEGYGALTQKEIYLLPLEMARINYFFICSAVLSLNPLLDFNNNIKQLDPFIQWLLSTGGKSTIRSLCKEDQVY